METLKRGVFLPRETEHVTSIQEPVPELAQVSLGNFAAGTGGGGGDAHTARKGAHYFQCAVKADLESTEHCSEPSPLQEPPA